MIATAPVVDANLKPPAELLQSLKRRVGQLQMLPAVAQEALQMVKDPNCSISQFTAVIKRDVKLTTDILRMANSALYCPVTPILDLNRCVMRVGFRECQYLILSASIASLIDPQKWNSQRLKVRGEFFILLEEILRSFDNRFSPWFAHCFSFLARVRVENVQPNAGKARRCRGSRTRCGGAREGGYHGAEGQDRVGHSRRIPLLAWRENLTYFFEGLFIDRLAPIGHFIGS